jgi:vacuolar-type H+-ATPase subunit E/Vma4
MKPLGSVAAVVAAIQEAAAAEVEAIDRDARRAIDRLRDEPEGEPADPRTAAKIALARERGRARLAQEDWEDTREAIAERELWIAEAVALGRARLEEREPTDLARERLTALVREALVRLPAGAVEVVVSVADAALLGPDWRAALAPAAPDSIRVVVGPVRGGCIVRSADGRASFDSSYDARAVRLQANWRSALAELYVEVTARATAASPPGDTSHENG